MSVAKQANKRMQTFFVIASLILAVTMVFVSVVNQNVVLREEESLRAINISGKQRMLSQRITHLSMHLKNRILQPDLIPYSQDDSVVRELYKAIEEMKQNAEGLLYGSEELGLPEAKPEMRDFYRVGDPSLSQLTNDFLQHANIIHSFANKHLLSDNRASLTDRQKRQLMKEFASLYSLSYDHLLNRLDYAVTMHEQINQRTNNLFRDIQPYLLLVPVLTLLALWGFVFLPLQRRVSAIVGHLDEEKRRFESDKERHELASKGAFTGIWDWDIANGQFHWNPILKQMLGLMDEKSETYTVDFFQGLLHDKDKNRFNEMVAQHIKDGAPMDIEVRLLHKSGDYIWVRIKGEALWDIDTKKAYRVVGSMIDITSQKQAEERNNIFLQGIKVAKIPFAIIDASDKQKRFTYASPAFCEITGYTDEKITKSNMNMFTGPKTSMNVLDKIDYALNECQKETVKIMNYRSDGSSFWNRVLIQPIFDQEGNFTDNYIVIFNDLTEEIRAQDQEIQRQRQESLGALAGSVAHEINNLLMPMSMAKDILITELKEDCDPFAREQLDAIVDYANQAKEIVNGILTFSRRDTIELRRMNFYEELKSSIEFIEGLLSANIFINFEEPDDSARHAEAMINATELKQIITNICKNAEHAMEGKKNGMIDISMRLVKLKNTERDKLDIINSECIKVAIKDHGKGIAKKDLEKIFEPLFTTKEVGKGTGLGLSVVIGIIKSWGGGIEVDSIVDKQTTFSLYVPLYKNDDDYSDLIDLVEELQS